MSHAKLSPSKRHRWAACPGSVREEARYPESPSGPAAIDGTHSHSLLEYCIKGNLIGPMHKVGHEMSDHDGTFRVDQDRARRVEVAVDYIRDRIREFGGSYELLSETRVDPEWLTGRTDLHGTVDVQLWLGNVYEIIDYKDGMGVVDAKDNPQLEQYGLGVLSRFKLQPGEQYPFDTVRFTIIQPKLALKGGQAISSWDISVADLLAKAEVIKAEAAATDDLNAPLVPGDKQCKFCAHKGSCSALAGNVMKEVGLMFPTITETPLPAFLSPSFGGHADLSAPVVHRSDCAVHNEPAFLAGPCNCQSVDLAQQSADKDPTKMTDAQLRQVLEAAPLVRQFIEGVEAEAQRRMEAGIPVPGFKLVRGRGSRGWTLPEDQMVEVLKRMGLPKEAIFETKLISPAKAEKVEWSKRDGTKVKLSDKQLQRLETEYIAKSSGKLVVAPESDSREAVVTNAAAMFAPVTPSPAALPAWFK